MKQLIENKTAQPMFVSGKLIPPGMARVVDVIDMSNVHAKPAFDPSAIMAGAVKTLPEQMVELNIEQLESCLNFEKANANRSTALGAIEDAIEEYETAADLAEFALGLSAVEDLNALLLSVKDNDAKVELVEFEIASREKGNNE